MKIIQTTKTLRKQLSELYIQMYLVSLDMEDFGDEKTKAHAKELLGASKVCREWSENARVKR